MFWGVLWRLVSVLATCGPPDMTTMAGAALVAVLLITVLRLIQPSAAADVAQTEHAVRSRAVRAGVPRHRDPDASGRTRPRGPTAAAAVA